jgi:1,4-dihydroxy-2-naphthoate octaprenyltransferase
MGVGIAHYLGVNIDWGIYVLGQAWVTILQLSTHFLNEYYNALEDIDNKNRTPFTGGSGVLGPGKLPRDTALYSALGSLAVLASLTVLLISIKQLEPTTILIMVLGFLGSFFYSTPPISLERTGYGELTASFIVSFLVPAFGFILQSGDLHRLIAMVTFPLFVLNLAMLIAFDLPDYVVDMKHEKRTLLVRIGWENGMNLHNLLIVIAFFLVALAASFQLPLFIALPALIPLPLGFLQIWQLRRIASGGKPNWTAVTLNALVIFSAMAYIFTFSFWIH